MNNISTDLKDAIQFENGATVCFDDVFELAKIGCSIADICDANSITVEDFNEVADLVSTYKTGHLQYIIAIRKAQLIAAQKLAPPVLVHLGKTVLRQSENITENNADTKIEITHNIITNDYVEEDTSMSVNNKKTVQTVTRVKTKSKIAPQGVLPI